MLENGLPSRRSHQRGPAAGPRADRSGGVCHRARLRRPRVGDQQLSSSLWRYRWIPIVCACLGILAAVATTLRQPKKYEAAALIQIDSAGTGEASIASSQEVITNYVTLLGSTGFL